MARADLLAAGLRPGARVVTVDSMLPNRGEPAADAMRRGAAKAGGDEPWPPGSARHEPAPAARTTPRFRLTQRATICEHTVYVWELSAAPPDLWIDYALLT